jgi:hypothetical protein
VSAIYACYALAVFTVWLVDAKQDIEQMPMLENQTPAKDAKKGHAKVQPMEQTASYNQLTKQSITKHPPTSPLSFLFSVFFYIHIFTAKQESALPTPPHITLSVFVAKVVRRLKNQHTWLSVYYRARYDSFNRIRRMTVVS